MILNEELIPLKKVIIRQDSASSESTDFNSSNESQNGRNSGKASTTKFDMSQTMTTVIVSYGKLDNQKRYVSEKEVDTRIGISDASTIAE